MQIAETTGYAVTAVIGVILNGIVIDGIRCTSHPYICTKITLHLSAANLFGCIFVILLHGFGDAWLLRNHICLLLLVFKSLWVAASILMTSFLVHQSVLRLRYQIKQLHTENVVDMNCLSLNFTLGLMWVGAVVIAIFTLCSIDLKEDRSLCMMYQHTNKDLVQYYIATIFIVPLVIIVLAYAYFRYLSANHKRSIGTYERDKKRINIHRDIHYMKSSFYISHVLLITWLPHALYLFCLIHWFVDNIEYNETTYHVLKFVQWVFYASSLFQPIVILKTNYQIKLRVLARAQKLWRLVCGPPTTQSNDENQTGVTPHNDSETDISPHNKSNVTISTRAPSHGNLDDHDDDGDDDDEEEETMESGRIEMTRVDINPAAITSTSHA